MMKRFQKGRFDMNDLMMQLDQMLKLGGMSGIMGMLPGMGKISKQLDEAGVDDKVLKRQIAIIRSMTKHERRNPDLMKASRKERVARGSGMEVQDVNRLLKMHRQMADMMKTLGRNKGMLNRLMGGGGGPAAPSEAELAAMQEELGKLDPKALEQLPKDLKEALPTGLPGLGGGGMPKLPRGLPGLGAGLPGLGGGMPKFPGVPGKKK
jgi:signal recognition particle subunit SRP54